jgi:hypothetical protein
MLKWLVIGAVASLAWSSGASAQMKGFAAREVPVAPHVRAHDFRIADRPPLPHLHPLTGGMLVSQELTPNAAIGLGFGSGHGRKRGADVRINSGRGRPHKPSLTFVMRF